MTNIHLIRKKKSNTTLFVLMGRRENCYHFCPSLPLWSGAEKPYMVSNRVVWMDKCEVVLYHNSTKEAT